MSIRVLINGADGKMGRTVVGSIVHEKDLSLVGTLGRDDNLAQAIQDHKADVVIDFTSPDSIFKTAETIITQHARPVIGTTGLSLAQITALQKQSKQQALGGVIAPNFSLAAVLMMRYAQDAVSYFPDAEIIELHHPKKLDAPSGTAKKTAEMMAETRASSSKKSDKEPPSRGEKHHDIPIHSVRLPGLVASQSVIFGGDNETLTIRHDTLNRQCFMPGVFLACRKVMELDHLVYGLEHLLCGE